LAIQLVDDRLLVAWPTSGLGFRLERCGSLAGSPGWREIAGEPAVVGGEYRVYLPLGDTAEFYRLAKP
jgi:hypothetical protein